MSRSPNPHWTNPFAPAPRLAALIGFCLLQTTTFIHEVYVRPVGDSGRKWENRAQCFGVAAKAMRRVLIDHARSRHDAKRGGERRAIPLDENIVISGERMAEIVALDETLVPIGRTTLGSKDYVMLAILEPHNNTGSEKRQLVSGVEILDTRLKPGQKIRVRASLPPCRTPTLLNRRTHASID